MEFKFLSTKNPNYTFWYKKNVLITGHTGFKGCWLTYWLLKMGANVSGISLEPETKPNMFYQLNLSEKLNHNIIDIRNKELLESKIREIQPEIIFHMAAQPLVIESYFKPIKTWETNVMGTFYLLNSLKNISNKCVCICITTDKVYKNNETGKYFKEEDPLGGYDPYSSSKAAAEIAIESFRSSFCGNSNHQKNNIFIASVRAGNVVGGGDWSENRLIPDIIKSIVSNKTIIVRNPNATRPWQHVLEPLSGYLKLAEKIFINNRELTTSFNFGPQKESNKKVIDLIKVADTFWPISWEIVNNMESNKFHEASFLGLEIIKVKEKIGWEPRWDFIKTVEKTFKWYKDYYNSPKDIEKYCNDDLEEFLKS